MECKFCKAQLEEDVTVCPVCGKEICEEIPENVEVEQAEVVQETAPVDMVENSTDEEIEMPEEIAEEPAPKKNPWKLAAMVAGCVVIAVILIGAVLYSLGIDLRPRENNVMYRDNYIVSDEKGLNAADKVVATVGDRTLTNAELQIYYWYGLENFFSYYGSYLSMMGIDQTQSLHDQVYDAQTGQSWQQYMLETALSSWHRYAVLNLMAEEAGFQLDAQLRESLDNMDAQLDQYALMYGFEDALTMIQNDWSVACNIDGYRRYMEANTIGAEYFNTQYDSLKPTADEVNAYFQAHKEDFAASGITEDSGKYIDVRHILVKPKGGTENEDGTVTYSDEEWETCRASAQEILDKWISGEATEDSFAALAIEHSEDGGSASNGGLYTQVYEGQMVPPFEEWCFDGSRQYGDTGLVQTTYGYHVMYFVDGYDIWYVNVESEIVSERANQMLEEAMERWPMEVKFKNIVIGDLYDTIETNVPETTVPTETAAQ